MRFDTMMPFKGLAGASSILFLTTTASPLAAPPPLAPINVRQARGTTCWLQDPLHAAYLGLTDTVKADVIQNFSQSSKDPQERFPTFWGPFHDSTPDEDNGGNGLSALQLMLLQPVGQKLLLLPAWPPDWDASFKLHAPQNTIVQGVIKAGHLTALTVTPQSRRKDVFLVQPDGTLTPL